MRLLVDATVRRQSAALWPSLLSGHLPVQQHGDRLSNRHQAVAWGGRSKRSTSPRERTTITRLTAYDIRVRTVNDTTPGPWVTAQATPCSRLSRGQCT